MPVRDQPAHGSEFSDSVIRRPKSCTSLACWPSGVGSQWSLLFTTPSWPKRRLIRPKSLSTALDQVMRDAAAMVLRGYELPTDLQVIRPGQRFFDKRGLEMWETISRLLAKLEERRA